MSIKQKPEILSIKSVAQSRLFRIEELSLQFSNGEKRQFERCRGALAARGAVLIVPLLDANTLVLLKEYAAGLDRYELSFPKGLVDEREDFIEAANRELKEEAGYGAHHITFLKQVSTSPNYMSGKMNLVIAQDLYPETLAGDEPEPLEVLTWPLEDYESLVAREDFTGAMNLTALYLARDYLRRVS